MAKSVIINGTTYATVDRVEIPLSAGGGNAVFVDTDSGDSAAADIRNGKKAWVDGNEITGSVAVRTGTDVTVSGKTVTVPVGIYDTAVNKSVADGSITPTANVAGDVIGATVSDYPVTVTPGATVGTAGYVSTVANGAAVTKYVQTENKSATPSGSSQDVTPSAGKLLAKVTVAAVALTGTATADKVLSGYTFYKDSLSKLTGTATIPSISLASGVLSIS